MSYQMVYFEDFDSGRKCAHENADGFLNEKWPQRTFKKIGSFEIANGDMFTSRAFYKDDQDQEYAVLIELKKLKVWHSAWTWMLWTSVAKPLF